MQRLISHKRRKLHAARFITLGQCTFSCSSCDFSFFSSNLIYTKTSFHSLQFFNWPLSNFHFCKLIFDCLFTCNVRNHLFITACWLKIKWFFSPSLFSIDSYCKPNEMPRKEPKFSLLYCGWIEFMQSMFSTLEFTICYMRSVVCKLVAASKCWRTEEENKKR